MGISSPSSLPQQWREFCSSGPPTSIRIGREMPCKPMESVTEDFSQGKAVVEAQLPDGRLVLFDFLHKRCLDLNDATKNYRLLWVDARGQIYGNKTEPPVLVLGKETDESSPASIRYQWHTFRRSGIPALIHVTKGSSRTKLPHNLTRSLAAAFAQRKAVVEAKISDGQVLVDFLRKVLMHPDDPSRKARITWCDNQGWLFTNGTVFGTEEQPVRRTFAQGTSGHFTATSVQRCNLHLQRLKTFRSMAPRPFVFGWYGSSASDVKEAAYGSGVVNINSYLLTASEAHGHGAHISPLSQPIKSALLADVDKGGESQVLFCSLALGWQEVIPAGSHQDQPSSPIYDTGVDNKSDPSWYIFWGGRMQTQITPLYIVSFIRTPAMLGSGPPPLGMYDDLTRFLPPSELRELERYCESYLKSEITNTQFADLLREHSSIGYLASVARCIIAKK